MWYKHNRHGNIEPDNGCIDGKNGVVTQERLATKTLRLEGNTIVFGWGTIQCLLHSLEIDFLYVFVSLWL